VEVAFNQVRVQPGIAGPDTCRNGVPLVAVESVEIELRRAQDRADAMPGKAVLPADLPALKSLVTGEEAVAKRVPLVEDHRETTINLAQTVVHAQHHEG
jgi:hypothetical protein